jgi:hypothetical protein
VSPPCASGGRDTTIAMYLIFMLSFLLFRRPPEGDRVQLFAQPPGALLQDGCRVRRISRLGKEVRNNRWLFAKEKCPPLPPHASSCVWPKQHQLLSGGGGMIISLLLYLAFGSDKHPCQNPRRRPLESVSQRRSVKAAAAAAAATEEEKDDLDLHLSFFLSFCLSSRSSLARSLLLSDRRRQKSVGSKRVSTQQMRHLMCLFQQGSALALDHPVPMHCVVSQATLLTIFCRATSNELLLLLSVY